MIRVVCVDDHPVVRAGLRLVIEALPGLAVVAEVGTAAAAREAVLRLKPDVLVIDVRLPDADGIATGALLAQAVPDMRIIVLSALAGDETIHRALEAGASGFVMKEYAETRLIAALRTVAAGRHYLPREAAELLISAGPRVVLTAREQQVLQAMAAGFRNKEIGRNLGMTEATARTHVESVRQKFRCRDRQATVALATSRGFLGRLPLDP